MNPSTNWYPGKVFAVDDLDRITGISEVRLGGAAHLCLYCKGYHNDDTRCPNCGAPREEIPPCLFQYKLRGTR